MVIGTYETTNVAVAILDEHFNLKKSVLIFNLAPKTLASKKISNRKGKEITES